MSTLSATAPRRLVLRAWPITSLHDFELIYWFRRWLADEHYLGCHDVQQELARREATGQLRVGLILDGLRDPGTGQPNLAGLNGLLDTWPTTYSHLFTSWAARRWLRDQQLHSLQKAAN